MSEPLDLEPIKARLNAAAPSPWKISRPSVAPDDPAVITGYGDWWVMGGDNDEYGNPFDADLIAHAPTDISALVAEVERLREENDKLVELYGKQREWTRFAADLGPFPDGGDLRRRRAMSPRSGGGTPTRP